MPDEFPKILKDYTKEVVRKGITGEADIVKFSMAYFEQLIRERSESQGGGYEDRNRSKEPVQKVPQMVVRKSNENIHDHYYISGIIGNPFDSKARLGVHKQTDLERAVKEVSKATIRDLGDFLKKLKLISTLDHPNICRYLEGSGRCSDGQGLR